MKMVQTVIFFAILLFVFSSCGGKTTRIWQYYLIKVEDPDSNNGNYTYANFVCKNEDGNYVQRTVMLSKLNIQINDKKEKYTILQETETQAVFQITKVYLLLVNSEEELHAWQEWKRKWTYIEIEPKPVYPPGYIPQNPDKPEKE